MTWRIQASVALLQHGMGHRAVTSPPDDKYNCIAWALGIDFQFWWPSHDGYWPGRRKGHDLAPTLDVFCTAFALHRYLPCPDANLELGFEKVALYSKAGQVTHAARQLPTGYWTSKLGPFVDIEHELRQIEGPEYGAVTAFLKRARVP
jgi:hypothetical protein